MNLQGDKLFLDISEADIPVSGPFCRAMGEITAGVYSIRR